MNIGQHISPTVITLLAINIIVVVMLVVFIKRYSSLKKSLTYIRNGLRKYKALHEASVDAVFLIKNRTIVEMNDTAAILFEDTTDKILYSSILSLFPDKQPSGKPSHVFFSEWTNAPLVEEGYVFEMIMRKKNGKEFYAEIRLKLIEYDGEPHIWLNVHDIEEKKQAEEVLILSENRYRSLVKAMPDITFILDRECVIEEFSAEDITKLAFKAENIIGKSFFDIGFSAETSLEMKLASAQAITFNKVQSIDCLVDNGIWKQYWEARISPFDRAKVLVVMRDVTERKNSEIELHEKNTELILINKSLEESEEKYRILFESAIDPILLIDDGLFIDCNDSAFKMLKYDSKDTIVGKNPSYFSPDIQPDGNTSVEKSIGYLNDAMEKGNIRFEWIHRKSDGTLFPVEVTLIAIPIRGKKMIYTMWRDLTEQRNAEADLRESELKFRQLAENIKDVFVLRTPDNKILYLSPSFETVFQRKREVLYKNPTEHLKWVHPEDLKMLEDAYMTAKQNRDFNLSVQHRMILPDGSVRWVWSREHPVINDLGVLTRFVTIISDITEQVIAEEEKWKLAVAVNQLSEMVIIANSKLFVEYVNKAYEKSTGFAKSDIAGKKPEYSEFSDIDFERRITNLLVSGNQWSGNLRCIRKDKTIFIQRTSITPIFNSAGEIQNFVFIGHDITQELQLQERLRQSQKLEAMGTLAGGIAHDFNNLLTPIQGYALLLKDEFQPNTQTHSDIEQILSASERAKELVNQILTFSRKVDVDYKPIDIRPLIKEVSRLVKTTIPAGIKFMVNLPEHPLTVLGDKTQLQQVLINLITNSIHATESSGTKIDVSGSIISFEESGLESNPIYESGQQFVRLSISDNGCGMSPELKSRVFEPFFSTRPKGKGTGLGLSIVHGIVKSMSGEISIYSEENIGTSINLYFPVAKGNEVVDVVSEEEIINGFGQNIVLVDDDIPVLNLTTRILTNLNYKVQAFTNPQEAISFLENEDNLADLIISDYTMPGMDGFSFLAEAGKVRPEIHAVIISGLAASLSRNTKTENIVDFIAKPFSTHQLGKVVAKALNL